MLVHNIQVFNNSNKPQYSFQHKNISFEARKLKLSKEVVLNTEQIDQLSFISKIYQKVLEFSAKLNGPYRYKFKDCFPGMVAGEVKKGFVFEGILPKADRRLQIAKLDARNEDELLSFRVIDKDFNGLITYRVNKNGTALISSDTESVPILSTNPFDAEANFDYTGFLSMISKEFQDLEIYSDNFTKISRKLKSNMNEKTVRESIVQLQAVQKSLGLKSEMDSLISNYTELDSLLKIGRSTNAVMYKRMYFGEDYDCAKGILFKNVGKNGETYLYCPAKSKDDDRVLRIVVSDKNGKPLNGFVFFADGRVMKQVSLEGIKAEDFRIQNLSSLSDSDIKTLGLRETMNVVDENISKFKSFVAEKVQAKSDKKARRTDELAKKAAERQEQRIEKRLKKERAAAEKTEARRIKMQEEMQLKQQKEEAQKAKEQEAARLKQQKEEAQKVKEQEAARLKQQKEEYELLRKAEKVALEEEKEILEQRKIRAQLVELTRQAKRVQERLLGAFNNKTPAPVERMTERRMGDLHATRDLIPKTSIDVKKPEKMPVIDKEKPQVNQTNVPLRPVTRGVATKTCTFNQFNISRFVKNLTELFATPVEERSPHLIHEYLPDGRIFKGRITVNMDDGAKVTVAKIKSPLYVDFSYYSVKITKDNKTYVLNIDKEACKVLDSTPEGKLVIDEKHRVHYLAKSRVIKKYPIADKIPAYLEELFVRRDDAERVVLSTGLKVSNLSTKQKLLAQKEQEVLKALGESDDSGINYLLS